MIVSRETSERLQVYADLIRRWNPRINLIAPSTLADLESRHIDDCLQLSNILNPLDGDWVDLGSGGGLPGIVLAAAFNDRPIQFHLVESDQRKSAFLRTAVREMGLDKVKIHNSRIEQLDPLNAAYMSARALAPLPKLMPYLAHHLAADGTALLMKGRKWQSELVEARQIWRFDVRVHNSTTEEGAATLEVSGVSHV